MTTSSGQLGDQGDEKVHLRRWILVGLGSIAAVVVVFWPTQTESLSLGFIVQRLPVLMVLIWQSLTLLGLDGFVLPRQPSPEREEWPVSAFGSGLFTVLTIAFFDLIFTLLVSFTHR